MNKKVLIIEDDKNFSQTLSQIFIDKFIEVKQCASAKEAEHLLTFEEYDLLIIDIMLPGVSGIEFLKKIIAKKDLQLDYKIWLISGVFKNKNNISHNIIKHIDLFLTKPIELKLINKHIDNILKSDNNSTNNLPFFYLNSNYSKSFTENKLYKIHSHELMFIFFYFCSIKFTGILNIEIVGIEQKTDVTFKLGNLVNFNFHNVQSYLGLLLVKRGLVSKEDIKYLLDQKNNKSLGEALIEGSYISPHLLYDTLRDQSVIRFFKIMEYSHITVSYKNTKVETEIQSQSGLNQKNLLSLVNYWIQSTVDITWLRNFFKDNQNMEFKFLNKLNWVDNISKYKGLNFLTAPITQTKKVVDILKEVDKSKHDEIISQLYCRLLLKENYMENKKVDNVNYDVIEKKYNIFLRDRKIKNYFELMNIPQEASLEQIKNSYRKMINIIHPDRIDKNIPQYMAKIYEKWFIGIDTMYKVLINPEEKKAYIKHLKQQKVDSTTYKDSHLKGKNYIESGRYEQALTHLQLAITIDNNSSDIGLYYIWAKIKCSKAGFTQKEQDEIFKIFSNLKLQYKQTAIFFFVKGLFMKHTNNKTSAKVLFHKAYETDPTLQIALIEKQSVSSTQSKSFLNFFKKSS